VAARGARAAGEAAYYRVLGNKWAPLNKAELTVLEFISFGAHIGSEYGGADMPLTGPIPEGRTFFCPHCGALYSVTYSRLSKSDSNIAKCVVCLQIMTSWDSTKVPIYKLVQRPEDA
jgi:hypothetical protein